jgi:hypothetical protein
VRRETLEETRWQFEPQALVGLYRWRQPESGSSFFRACFSGLAVHYHAERPLDADISATCWLSAGELRQQSARHRSPLVQRCVDDYLRGQRFSLQLLQDLSEPRI